MYVSGQLSESDTVLVDVGTGYFIDMVRMVLVSNSHVRFQIMKPDAVFSSCWSGCIPVKVALVY